MVAFGRAGVSWQAPGAFAPPSEQALGNNNPAWTGSHTGPPDMPGPHPPTQPIGGQTGDTDGFGGADPSRPKRSPRPQSAHAGAWGQALAGDIGPAKPPLGYGGGAPRPTDGAPARLGPDLGGDPLPDSRPSWWRGGIQGTNDDLQVRDRHAYWRRGHTRGLGNTYTGSPASGRNPQLDGPPMPVLATVNISVNPQIGSDSTRLQDDLSRPYTWLGQWDGTRQAVYGGVPGLWQAYGNRGFSPGIHDPSNGEGGPAMVASGPPHGLHSDTIPDGKQLIDRFKTTAQNVPARIDRPSNSTAAGQSFSQTVPFQGAGSPAQGARPGFSFRFGAGSTGWRGGGTGIGE
jgi:hypothetical protein